MAPNESAATTAVRPFRVEIPDDSLDDLHNRLARPAGPIGYREPAGAAACRSTT